MVETRRFRLGKVHIREIAGTGKPKKVRASLAARLPIVRATKVTTTVAATKMTTMMNASPVRGPYSLEMPLG